jgi:dGTPase
VLNALIDLRGYLFDAVYENEVATAEFGKASGILGGLWEKVRQRPEDFLDLRTVEQEGIDVAAQDFIAGMTDRYALAEHRRLFDATPDLR